MGMILFGMRTHQMPFVALRALFHRVILSELAPVPLLLRRENPRARAQWTLILQRRQDGCADERRAIRDCPQRLDERCIRLERDDALFGTPSEGDGTSWGDRARDAPLDGRARVRFGRYDEGEHEPKIVPRTRRFRASQLHEDDTKLRSVSDRITTNLFSLSLGSAPMSKDARTWGRFLFQPFYGMESDIVYEIEKIDEEVNVTIGQHGQHCDSEQLRRDHQILRDFRFHVSGPPVRSLS